MQKRQLSKKDIKEINSKLEVFGVEIDKKEKVEFLKGDSDAPDLVLVNSEPAFFYLDDSPVPTLKNLLKNNFLKKAVVDMGAVKFVANGADIMRPGIVSLDEEIAEGEIVSVVDETHKKPLAVCRALFSGKEMAVIAIFSGIILTLIVPFLIPLILT